MPTVLAQVEAALPQLVASIIIAALSWMGSQIVNWFKRHRQPATPSAQASAPAGLPVSNAPPLLPPYLPQQMPQPGAGSYAVAVAPRRAAPAINWGQALLHIGILQLVVNAVGVLLGILVGVTTPQSVYQTTFVLVQLLVGTLCAMVTFMVFGLRVAQATMWRHLVVVALGTVVLTLLVNSLFELQLYILNLAAVLFALIQTFAAMGVGGGVAALVRPKAPTRPAPLAPSPIPYPSYPGAQPLRVDGRPPVPGYPPAGYPPAGYPPAGYPPNYPPLGSPANASPGPTSGMGPAGGLGPAGMRAAHMGPVASRTTPYPSEGAAPPPASLYPPYGAPMPQAPVQSPLANAQPSDAYPSSTGQAPPADSPQQP